MTCPSATTRSHALSLNVSASHGSHLGGGDSRSWSSVRQAAALCFSGRPTSAKCFSGDAKHRTALRSIPASWLPPPPPPQQLLLPIS